MAAPAPMVCAWLHHFLRAFAYRWLPVLAGMIGVRIGFDGLEPTLHRLPLTLAIVAGLALLCTSWRFWRDQRRRRRRFG
ncbi:hypothetical protein MTR62_18530 [Novosphingobium sp. 1949]|uniref:Uncharacterized protein n=1 Tax=Novosphingobium organovorum TaxID=2930092 RepID=A0ABT0BI18_9SPHN|nr:hypothetical protein [Novosphingobium organovorum]MCJ2184669.1 hypothetical protein [Novosphingobium organovorum]